MRPVRLPNVDRTALATLPGSSGVYARAYRDRLGSKHSSRKTDGGVSETPPNARSRRSQRAPGLRARPESSARERHAFPPGLQARAGERLLRIDQSDSLAVSRNESPLFRRQMRDPGWAEVHLFRAGTREPAARAIFGAIFLVVLRAQDQRRPRPPCRPPRSVYWPTGPRRPRLQT